MPGTAGFLSEGCDEAVYWVAGFLDRLLSLVDVDALGYADLRRDLLELLLSLLAAVKAAQEESGRFAVDDRLVLGNVFGNVRRHLSGSDSGSEGSVISGSDFLSD